MKKIFIFSMFFLQANVGYGQFFIDENDVIVAAVDGEYYALSPSEENSKEEIIDKAETNRFLPPEKVVIQLGQHIKSVVQNAQNAGDLGKAMAYQNALSGVFPLSYQLSLLDALMKKCEKFSKKIIENQKMITELLGEISSSPGAVEKEKLLEIIEKMESLEEAEQLVFLEELKKDAAFQDVKVVNGFSLPNPLKKVKNLKELKQFLLNEQNPSKQSLLSSGKMGLVYSFLKTPAAPVFRYGTMGVLPAAFYAALVGASFSIPSVLVKSFFGSNNRTGVPYNLFDAKDILLERVSNFDFSVSFPAIMLTSFALNFLDKAADYTKKILALPGKILQTALRKVEGALKVLKKIVQKAILWILRAYVSVKNLAGESIKRIKLSLSTLRTFFSGDHYNKKYMEDFGEVEKLLKK